MAKIHFLDTSISLDKRVINSVLCNGNGVPNLSLSKRYMLTQNKKAITCKKCLYRLKIRNQIKECV